MHENVYNNPDMGEEKAWENVLNTLFCQTARLRPVRHDDAQLPPYLRGRYSVYRYRVPQGELLAIRDRQWNGAETPEDLLGAAARFQKQYSEPCVLLVGELTSTMRQRYVGRGVPFVSLSGVAFIPGYFAQLGSLRAGLPLRGEKVNTHGQLMFLRHMLHGDVSGMSLRRIAEMLHCHPIQISRGKDSLAAHALCSYSGRTRNARFSLPEASANLWLRARDVLSSPVVRTLFLNRIPTHAPMAGERALSRMTLLSPPDLPCFAMGREDASRIPAARILPDAYGAAASVQVWRYAPALLMQPGDTCVDPLSLYLSLMDEADDRILQELQSLPMPWTPKH